MFNNNKIVNVNAYTVKIMLIMLIKYINNKNNL